MNEKPETWPLLPSHSSYTLHGITIALADALHHEVTYNVSPRTLLKVHGLATAAEAFANELAHFFGSQSGEDHDHLEAIQQRYLENPE
ncbi:MAG TPA: hypothetical protein VF275_09410 [Gammaproteobacteria bacterium]